MEGLILIDKPADMTSHDVVDVVRKVAQTRRVGHAGTLDPFATGLLILGIGKATKILTQLVGLDKAYLVTAQLGATTNTYDVEGTVVSQNVEHIPEAEEIEHALQAFRGGYRQKAPAFSAKKVKGKRLYELAREGKTNVEVLRPEKDVRIERLHIVEYAWPNLTLDVTCSSGTYIRSLVYDIGEALHVGAYAKTLRRTAIGPYSVEGATLLKDLDKNRLNQGLFTLDNAPVS
ncbi:tRNA pseudouridine(55) synthase TruB [Candidatus Uhrbacteria bacterium CG22_combo_CG10-13_8_21_14_all_47_17]|uniref:tRNA pseudouridine synthase B n=1 Tax=Candidatus Uhrbacteria bacterium CG22_combo_CG10-13_8_21_14_all_47_17 TaxID=1975041 RepID=A0A2H0BTN0_9BACT|nr:MAG: tRNA pseudouridine(55) synthase TruB [Candidatus Uhrbacteria bacterium CG22_combo_CG10-13_8_21_14_all_47_17]